jgi:hypothetical protein
MEWWAREFVCCLLGLASRAWLYALGCCLCCSSWSVCPALFGVCVSPSSLGVLGGIAFSGGLLALFFLGLSRLGSSCLVWSFFPLSSSLVPFLFFGVLALSSAVFFPCSSWLFLWFVFFRHALAGLTRSTLGLSFFRLVSLGFFLAVVLGLFRLSLGAPWSPSLVP